jgi:hypothetical protein
MFLTMTEIAYASLIPNAPVMTLFLIKSAIAEYSGIEYFSRKIFINYQHLFLNYDK